MKIHYIGESNSVLNTFISEIRDKEIQKDSLRFRRNIERIGEILSYELSKTLSYSTISVDPFSAILNSVPPKLLNLLWFLLIAIFSFSALYVFL